MANLSLATGAYRFCIDGTGTALKSNLANTSSITAAAPTGTAVKTATQNGFRAELWYWNGSNLRTEYGRTFGNRYLTKNASNKAALNSTSATITLEEVASGTYKGKKCKIKIGTSFLVSNGTQCTFTTTASSGTTWSVEPVRRMTSMPDGAGYPERVEYFHPNASTNEIRTKV